MKALVTGGAGFIGSTLVRRLLAEGGNVVVLDDFSTGRRSNLTGLDVQVHELDIREPRVTEAIAGGKPDVVFHLAAQMDVRVSVRDPLLDAEINVLGGLRVIEGARLAGAKVVFASSGGTIYGDPDPSLLPITESAPSAPMSPYGLTKRAFGEYLALYGRLHALRYTALALPNVYGPRQRHDGEAGVVSIFAGKMLTGGRCTIFGDGSQTRDYVFVDDVVDAFFRSASAGDQQLLNIGSGAETSVLDIHKAVAIATGASSAPIFAAERPGEVARSCLDPGAARVALGWSATTDLMTGITRVVDCLREGQV